MHLTGRYPDWWQGKEFKRAPLGWAASETSEITRDGVQRILMGRLPAGEHMLGTGAIPKDAIVEFKRRQHGAADALEFVVVRWGGGGDVGSQRAYIGFKSYDQGRRKFQAETLDFVWFDEEPDADIYFEGLTRTNTTLGLCSMTFTPLKGMSAVVARFLIEQPPQTHVTQMGIVDALHYTDEQRAAIIASYPPHERRARAYGEPTLGSGAIFAVEDAAITIDPFPIPDHWALIAGIDFGWDHPTAASLLAHDRDNDVIYVVRCLRARETTPAMFVSALRQTWSQKLLDWLPWAWPHDGRQGGGKFDRPEQEQLQQIYADHGLKMLAMHAQFENGSNGVEPGVQDMLDRMNTGRWKVFATCGEWLEEKRLYHRKDGLIVKERDDLLCLHPDTMVITPGGARRIVDMVGTEGLVLAPDGRWTVYRNCRQTRRNAPTVVVEFDDGSKVRCTPDHLFLTTKGWVPASGIGGMACHNAVSRREHAERQCGSSSSQAKRRYSMVFDTRGSVTTTDAVAYSSIGLFGRITRVLSRAAGMCIMLMAIGTTTRSRICWRFVAASTYRLIRRAMAASRWQQSPLFASGARRMLAGNTCGPAASETITSCGWSANTGASSAEPHLSPRMSVQTAFVPTHARAPGAGHQALISSNGYACGVVGNSGRISLMPSGVVRTDAQQSCGDPWMMARPYLRALRVTSADPCDVYCMEVPDGEAFAVETGAVVHNCSSRYGFMMRRFAVTPPRQKRAVRNEQRARNWRVI